MQATDYSIFQRDADGFAKVPFAGALDNCNGCVYARAVREEDRLPLVPWTLAAVDQAKNEWHVAFTLPSGGLYTLEACVTDGACAPERARRIKFVRHVGVGEVWMLAGQSNMSGYGREAAFDPPTLGVHLFANDGAWRLATHPLNDSIDTIYPENAEYACGSSPALAFGRTLRARLGVPVGLVQASLGGSPLSKWNLGEDGTLTRAMLRRTERTGRVGGILWFQGCSDAQADGRAQSYLARFEDTVLSWRRALGDINILTAQLNRHIMGADARGWGMVREAQRKAARTIDKLAVVSTIDAALSDGIHNSTYANVMIGERLASAALTKFYHLPGQTSPNAVECTRVDERTLKLVFEEGREMYAPDDLATGMHVEDASGLIECERAVGHGREMTITTARAYALPACFHAYWTCAPTREVARDMCGMPMLSVYGMEIK